VRTDLGMSSGKMAAQLVVLFVLTESRFDFRQMLVSLFGFVFRVQR
jgi:hypothetical protein